MRDRPARLGLRHGPDSYGKMCIRDRVNFPGMEQLIDAVGGIDLEATEEVDDPAHLDVKVEKG